ncbi:uncharacterized protein LOC134275645 [Saccostrea cucullata]|uniref:uncharacterized protein LOC134275645 n=1 Tax=Saccostrea cuccullata TaxID=36930 RepID=UPI002ED4A721
MPRLVLQKSIRVKGVSQCVHISRVSSDRVWICDKDNLILTNTAGEELTRLTGISSGEGVHTVTSDGDLIYIDRKGNIIKLSKDNTVKTVLKSYNTEQWEPHCVYSSPSTGYLLVGIYNKYTRIGQVNRYTKTGRHLQTIQHDNTGQGLYRYPFFITENRNGDVIVTDPVHGVVVTDSRGRHRFSYTELTSGLRLWPYGICTDALSHILVCDYVTQVVKILDRDGHFLSNTKTPYAQHGKDGPCGLNYDDRTQFFWVGSRYDNTVNIYRLIYEDSLTALPVENLKCEKHPKRYIVSSSVSRVRPPCVRSVSRPLVIIKFMMLEMLRNCFVKFTRGQVGNDVQLKKIFDNLEFVVEV